MAMIHGWSLPRTRREEPPFFSKSQVISVLEQVGILLQLVGANPFRIRAYENAALLYQVMKVTYGARLKQGH